MAGIVANFGGSSLADAAQLEKVKKIIGRTRSGAMLCRLRRASGTVTIQK